MATKSRVHSLTALALIGATLAACGSNSRTGAPRVTTIPAQTTSGGDMFTLDLSEFVSDPEGQNVTLTVVSGGGAFSSSTYSNMFETMGTYTVVFEATDGAKTTTGEFVVEVTAGNFAVTSVDARNLRLLDTDTEQFVLFSESGQTETFRAGLDRGVVVFERAVGSQGDLFAFDVFTRETLTLGDDASLTESYVARTSDDRVVFTTSDGTDTRLFIWNPATGVTRTIDGGAGIGDRNATVSVDDIVFYERESNGQSDVYRYDPDEDESAAISTHPREETIRGVDTQGGLVFSRVGGGGETDLYYWAQGTGLVEVGATNATLDTLPKTYHASGSTGQVVFSVDNGGSNDLWFWDPADGSVTQVGTAVTFGLVTSNDRIVFATNGDTDIALWNMISGTAARTVSNDAAAETILDTLTKNGVAYVIYSRAAAPTSLHVYNVAADTTADIAAGSALQLDTILGNGDLVFSATDGTSISSFEPNGGAVTAVDTGTSIAFGGAGADAGDFAYTKDGSSDTDLFLWDASATAIVTVSDGSGVDSFGAVTSAGEVLFRRIDAGNTTGDLLLFDPADDTVVALTGEEDVDPISGDGRLRDHAVVGTFSASR